MIHMLTAYTAEIDDVSDALDEILGHINLETLKKNSVGLITCHYDFTDTGFINALCEKLPFEVIGMTTIASANQHGYSMYALSLTVLTSDEVIFSTAATGSINPDNYREKIATAYSDAAKKLNDKPSLIITFFPFLKNLSGALMHRALNDTCEGIPFWGSIATNTDVNYERCAVFRNSDICQDGLVMALLQGPIDPDFIVVSIPAQNIQENRGKITSAEGCLLREINGIPALKYLESLGIVVMKDASITMPLMVYHQGSSVPIATAIYSVHDDGSLLCGGEVENGAYITVGEITVKGILSTADEGMTKLLDCGRRNGALILPCVTRYVMMLPDHNNELKHIASRLENGTIMPYMAGYAGGEICPVRDESGILRNRFHGFTFSACVF